MPASSSEPSVSVIMPVYNVELYLRQCIESVLSQRLRDIEIIIVNDGSRDGSPAIIDEYAAKDARIKPIHQENGGYGKAVNAGLAQSTGKYIAIVETDDWIEPDMLEVLFRKSEELGVDVAKSSFMKHTKDGASFECSLRHIVSAPSGLVRPCNSLEFMLYESSIWSGLYRRSFIEDHEITMLETAGAAYQDVVWKFAVYSNADKVFIINKPLYNYRVMAIGSSSTLNGKEQAMFRNYREVRLRLESDGIFEQFKTSFFVHQIFDFAFHMNRLSGQALDAFKRSAVEVVEEAERNGIDIAALTFHPDINHYFQTEVLPLYEDVRLQGQGEQSAIYDRAAGPSLNQDTKKRRNVFRRMFWRVFIRPILKEYNENLQQYTDYLTQRFDELTERYEVSQKEGEAQLSAIRSRLDGMEERWADLTTKLDQVQTGIQDTCRRVQALDGAFSVDLIVPPAHQFEYYLRANRAEIGPRIAKLKDGMDADSRWQVDRYFAAVAAYPLILSSEQHLRLPLSSGFLSNEEQMLLSNRDTIVHAMAERYADLDLTGVPLTFVSMYFESGLKVVPYRLTENFKGKIALDCGASIGDSAIPIARYGFSKVFCFEPLPDAFAELQEVISRNSLQDYIQPIQKGVDEYSGEQYLSKIGEKGEGSFVSGTGDMNIDVTSIDDFTVGLERSVGLIKLDVEGKELSALKGAEHTIKTNRPILLVAIYHTWMQPEQIFDVKSYIDGLGLDYEFQFKWLEPGNLFYEHWLIAYPRG